MADANLQVVINATDNASKTLDGITGKIQDMKKGLQVAGGAMVAVGGSILATAALSLKSFSDMGSAILEMSQKTGFSTKTISELKFALEQCGASIDDLQPAYRQMANVVTDASNNNETAIKTLNALGLSYDDLKGKSPEDTFILLADAVAAINDPLNRASTAQDIFGRSASSLLPLLSEGQDGIAKLRNEANELGIVLDEQAAKKADAFGDAMTRLKGATDGLKMTIGGILAESLKPMIDDIKNIIVNIDNWTKAHPTLTKYLTLAATALGALLVPIGIFLMLAPGIATAIGAITLVSSPWLLIIGAIVGAIVLLVAAGVALYTNWDTICAWARNVRDWFVQLKEKVVDFVTNAVDWLKSHWELLVSVIFPFAGIIIQLIKHWDDLKRTIVDFALNAIDFLREKFEMLIAPFKKIFEWIGKLHGQGGEGVKELSEVMHDTLLVAIVDVSNKITFFNDILDTCSQVLTNVKAVLPSLVLNFNKMTGAITNVIMMTFQLIAALEAIPREITVTINEVVTRSTGDGGGGSKPPTIWMQHGGIINEPIFGVGASGRRYAFGESGPEIVTPSGGETHVHLELDGRELARVVLDRAGRLLRLQGAA